MNIELKIALIREFGSQIVAARHLRIGESRLSHIVRGHAVPSPRERAAFEEALGSDLVGKLFQPAPPTLEPTDHQPAA